MRRCTVWSCRPSSSAALGGVIESSAACPGTAGWWTSEAQRLSVDMMKVLINEEYVVAPLAATFRIYGMAKNVSFPDPHPSFNNQTWFNLAMMAR